MNNAVVDADALSPENSYKTAPKGFFKDVAELSMFTYRFSFLLRGYMKRKKNREDKK